MSYYRDTATALTRRAPGNFIGVVLYVPMGGQSTSSWWWMSAFPSSKALQEWYEEIAGAPTLYYYLAAFDKARGAVPVGESIAPPKPGMPGFDIHSKWRASPFKPPGSDRPVISGEGRGAADMVKTAAIFALFAIPFGIVLSRHEGRKQIQAEKAEFRRLGMDWSQRTL